MVLRSSKTVSPLGLVLVLPVRRLVLLLGGQEGAAENSLPRLLLRPPLLAPRFRPFLRGGGAAVLKDLHPLPPLQLRRLGLRVRLRVVGLLLGGGEPMSFSVPTR